MRRLVLVLAAILTAASLVPSPAEAAPGECAGLFWGIEATCMFRSSGGTAVVTGTAVHNGNPPAQIVVELWRLPADGPEDLLARCQTDGGPVQGCVGFEGVGALPASTKVLCRISGIGDIGSFACTTF
jgi:hypothetical protein